jgi:uncharacterized membrane protein YgaE (UPF0421/DUF939 family)
MMTNSKITVFLVGMVVLLLLHQTPAAILVAVVCALVCAALLNHDH